VTTGTIPVEPVWRRRRVGGGAGFGLRRLPLPAQIGLAILAGFAVMGVIGPLVAPYDPSATSSLALAGPSWQHLLGTTQTGQDVLSQLLVGSRTTLLIGVVAGFLATILAAVIGLAAGYWSGLAGELLSSVSNLFLVLPVLPLVIVMGAYLKDTSWFGVVLVIVVVGWATGARIIRAQVLSLRRRDFVLAAQATGEGTGRLLGAEILPHVLPMLASGFVFSVLFAVVTQATLAFIGLGNIGSWSWGTMLYWAQNSDAFSIGAWWWFVPPGACLALVGTGLVLCNFAIDAAFGSRLHHRGDDTSPVPALVPGVAGRRLGPTAFAGPARGGETDGSDARGLPAPRPSRRWPIPVTASGGSGGEVLLDVVGLSVAYRSGSRSSVALADVDLQIRRGEVVGIAGETGSGKSTLVHAVTRLLRPPGVVTAGTARFSAAAMARPVDLLQVGEPELRQLRWEEISVVLQSAMAALNPVLDVGSQLVDVVGAHRPRTSRVEARHRAAEVLQLVGLRPEHMRSYPHELSGGMRQRVLLAMALILQPSLVVLDEPTTALDMASQRDIVDEVLRLRRRLGFAVLLVTHDVSLLLEVADTVAVLYAGRVVEAAAASDLYHRALHPYTTALLASVPALHGPGRPIAGIPGTPPSDATSVTGCSFHPRCASAMAVCRTERPELRQWGDPRSAGAGASANASAGAGVPATRLAACLALDMAGTGLSPSMPGPSPRSADGSRQAGGASTGGTVAAAGDRLGAPPLPPVLAARDLRKSYRRRVPSGGGRMVAVDGVSLTLGRGEAVALVGESGSGKSTVARILARLEPPDAGSLWLGEQPVLSRRRSLASYRHHVQLVLQDPYASLNSMHSVRYHLRRAVVVHRAAWQPAEGTKAGRSDLAVDAVVDQLLGQVGLSASAVADRMPGSLSGGQRQRVAIARALAARPQVLIADEPVSMLDVSVRAGVVELLDRLRREQGMALLHITHDLASARASASRVLVMLAGRVVESGPIGEVLDAPAHPYTSRLLAAQPDPARRWAGPPAGTAPGPSAGTAPESPAGTAPGPSARLAPGSSAGPAAWSRVGSPVGSTDDGSAGGCPLRLRCRWASAACGRVPPLVDIGGGRQVACWAAAEATRDRSPVRSGMAVGAGKGWG